MTGAKVLPDDVAVAAARPSSLQRVVQPLGRRAGVLGPVLLLALLQALVALLFSWPAAGSTPHGVPVAVAGPVGVADAATRSLEAARKGALTVTRLPDLASARSAVRSRRVYGAVVIETDGLRLLVASGASPTVASDLLQAVDAIQARALGTYLQVEDLAPNPRRDRRGQAPAAALLAVLITAVAAGAVVHRSFRTARGRCAALLCLAVLGAAGSVAVLHGMLGALNGSAVAEAGVLALVTLTVSGATVAFGVVAQAPGLVLAALLMVALGYPVSGASSAPELVPAPWDAVGRLLPAGAANTALRDVAFFGGSGSGASLTVLGFWSVLSLLVVVAPEAFLAFGRRAARAARTGRADAGPPVARPTNS